MSNYELPIWFGKDGLSRAQVMNLDGGEILIEVMHGDELASVRNSFRVSPDVAEMLAANILTAIRAAQLKKAA
jgi:hypothetical protein